MKFGTKWNFDLKLKELTNTYPFEMVKLVIATILKPEQIETWNYHFCFLSTLIIHTKSFWGPFQTVIAPCDIYISINLLSLFELSIIIETSKNFWWEHLPLTYKITKMSKSFGFENLLFKWVFKILFLGW